ncbi:MAG: hypothetical protein DHS20C15_14240 [Planctomycetota bacterium]|nr:MAG: hypothetical protein DHS20C15_14240 [Planctomycetota bacterium]
MSRAIARSLSPDFAVLLFGALLTAPLSAQAVLETWTGPGADDAYGDALDNAGDVDGDGVDDLIVGSPSANGGAGRVEVASGRTGNVLITFLGAGSDALGTAVAGVGDMNGDGLSEIAFSAPGRSLFIDGQVKYDPVTIWNFANRGSGYYTYWSLVNEDAGMSLSGKGDGDGDGRADLLIGIPFFDAPGLADAGRVLRIRHTPFTTQILEVARGTQAGERLGHAVAWVGEVVGGSSTDYLAVSAPYRDQGGAQNSGHVYVMDGFGNPLWNKAGPAQTGAAFGWSLSGGVDISGNGSPDVVVGSPWYDATAEINHGRVVVYRGHSGAFYASRVGDDSGDLMGWDVQGVIVDGDPHVFAGAPGDGETGGFTLLDRGVLHRLTGFGLATTWTALGGASWGYFGRTIAVLADMNNDGSQEFAVGQPYTNFFQSNAPGIVRLYDGQTHLASWNNYGDGLAGTLGVPQLELTYDPQLQSNSLLIIENSRGVPTLGLIVIGFATAALPFKMGTLHVLPQTTRNLASIPVPSLDLSVSTPDDHTISGLTVYLQVAELDPGSPSGVSLSQGLQVNYGV